MLCRTTEKLKKYVKILCCSLKLVTASTKLAADYSKQVHVMSDVPHLGYSFQPRRIQMLYKHYKLLLLNHLTQQFNLQLVQFSFVQRFTDRENALQDEAYKQYLSLNCWKGRGMDNCGLLHSFVTHECTRLSSWHPTITVFTERDELQWIHTIFHPKEVNFHEAFSSKTLWMCQNTWIVQSSSKCVGKLLFQMSLGWSFHQERPKHPLLNFFLNTLYISSA